MRDNIILINGINNSSAGGKTILLNFVHSLLDYVSEYKFLVFAPEVLKKDFQGIMEVKQVDFVFVKKPNIIDSLYWYLYGFSKIIINNDVSLVVNFGDIPIRNPKCNQIFYFDWAHAIYPESEVWSKFSFRTKFSKKMKLYLFKKLFKFNDHIITQTKTATDRLKKLYPPKSYTVLNNPVSAISEDIEEEPVKIFLDNSYFHLLILSRYYEHKNLESIIPLAKEILRTNEKVRILITLERSHGIKARRFLNRLKSNNLEGIIFNLGEVNLSQIKYLYRKIDALYMPTLLESFSGTYIEAMYFRKPILTTDIDFAREICGDGAIYFRPFDTVQQLNAIRSVVGNSDLIKRLTKNQTKQLENFIDWNTKTHRILEVVKSILNE